MLIEGRVHKTIDLQDLNSLVSLKQWLEENVFAPGRSISPDQIKLSLSYLAGQVSEHRPDDKSEWQDRIEYLISRNNKDGK
jgi:hypothetical protein